MWSSEEGIWQILFLGSYENLSSLNLLNTYSGMSKMLLSSSWESARLEATVVGELPKVFYDPTSGFALNSLAFSL